MKLLISTSLIGLVLFTACTPTEAVLETEWTRLENIELGIALTVPTEFTAKRYDPITWSLSYWGPTQIEGTEFFDGMSVYAQKWTGELDDPSLKQVAEAFYAESAYDMSELESTTLNEIPAYTYQIEGMGRFTSYVFENSSGDFLYMSTSAPDPGSLGYEATMERILDSLELL